MYVYLTFEFNQKVPIKYITKWQIYIIKIRTKFIF